MAQALISDTLRPQSTVSLRREVAYTVVTLITVAFFAFLAIYRHAPTAVVPASAPPTEFSAQRALESLHVISSRTRPIGSSGHTAAADYIFQKLSALGLEPQVQQTTAVNQTWGIPFRAGTVRNIVARLKGREDGRALLLASHYDTVPQSFGASDDGSGVAVMLETMRALKARGTLKNDVILLFSDAEEVGMLGAKAFAEQHPWARNVGLVINFEARGTSGPALMFETSGDNGWLIQEYSKSAVHPVTNSLLYEAYKFLPNDTDLTIFKKAGFSGLNFAFIDSSTNYHTRLDSLENLDGRSLQHAGANALALVQHFGNLDLTQTKRGDAVYFDVLGLFVVSYPVSWVLPLTLLTVLLFIVIVGVGRARGALTLKGMLFGALAFLLSLACVGIVVSLCWRAVRATHAAYALMEDRELYNSLLYLIGFCALTVAIVSALYSLLHRRIKLQDLWTGALSVWLLLLLAASIYVPGASYLLMWPLLSSLLALGGTLTLKEWSAIPATRLAILLAGAIPGLILWSPIIYLLFVGLTANASAIVMVSTALLLGLLIPHLRLLTTVNKWVLPGALAIVSVVFVVAGSFTASFNKEHPKPDNIFYAFNGDTGNAVWASTDARPDEWTSQFFQAGAKREALAEFFPFRSGDFLTGNAPAATLLPPALEVLSDTNENGVRRLKLRATSPRGASVLTVYVESDAEVADPAINGRLLEASNAVGQDGPKKQWGFRYYAVPPEGVEWAFTTKSTNRLTVKLIDQSYGLPGIPNSSFAARPENSMASLAPFDDSTLASKSFAF
jgi:hypothetical protein